MEPRYQNVNCTTLKPYNLKINTEVFYAHYIGQGL